MKKLVTSAELKLFSTIYKKFSGLSVSVNFLQKNQVFGFHKDGQMVGGFVIAEGKQLRTIECHTQDFRKYATYKYIADTSQFCEICCLWLKHSWDRHPFSNVQFWLQLAHEVRRQKKDFIIFGTNHAELAKLYHYSKKSILIATDRIANKDTYIFVAKRASFFWGVCNTLLAKISRRTTTLTKKTNVFNKYDLHYELSS